MNGPRAVPARSGCALADDARTLRRLDFIRGCCGTRVPRSVHWPHAARLL